MASSQKSMVSIVAILAIVILVGVVIWFVREESDSTIEIDLGSESQAPTWFALRGSPPPPPVPIAHV